MPFADNNGVQIYYEVEGVGPPLILLHGSSQSHETWRLSGYGDGLGGDYQLVLMDARGHGKSDKPHNTESYRAELMAGDVVAVLDDLGLPTVAYFGYSMGGRIGYYLAKLAPDRINALIIGGAPPSAPPSAASQAEIDTLRRGGVEAVAAGRSSAPEQRAITLANDPEAWIARLEGFAASPPVTDVLETIAVPTLLFAGDADPRFDQVKSTATQIPGAEFRAFPGLNHIQAMNRSDLVVPLLRQFLATVYVDA